MLPPNDLTQAIVELSDTESKELVKLYSNPLIIKHLRIVGMAAVFEQAKYPYEKLHEQNNLPFLLEMAYQKGIMHMADTILSYTANKENTSGPSTSI